MNEITGTPDIRDLEIPTDAWTEPFWKAAAAQKLLLPRCGDCGQFRWPPGPFCPECRSQEVEWRAPGNGRVYAFTILRNTGEDVAVYAPALIEFPDAGGVRLLAAIVDTPLSAIRVGAEVELDWSDAGDTKVPIFRVAGEV